MSSSAVQFRGADQAVEAYEMNAVPSWALFVGKEILGQYRGQSVEEGGGMLHQWCEKLRDGMSNATYQLRMYEGEPRTINNTTPYNFSFRFKLITDDEAEGEGFGTGRVYRQLLERVNALEAEKLARNLEDEEEEEEIGGVQGFIGNLLNKPEVQNYLMQAVGGFVSRMAGIRPQPAAMAGTPDQAASGQPVDMTQVYANLPADQQALLNRALEILLTKDPQAGTRLYKIALILQNNPDKYAMLAGML